MTMLITGVITTWLLYHVTSRATEQKIVMKRINSILFGLLIPFLSVFILAPRADAFDSPARYGGWHMGPGMMGTWGAGGFGWIFMLVFWALVIAGLICLFRWLIPSKQDAKTGECNTGPGAMEILRQRYARGEIDQAEFETKKRILTD